MEKGSVPALKSTPAQCRKTYLFLICYSSLHDVEKKTFKKSEEQNAQ